MHDPERTIHVLQGQHQVSANPNVRLATVLGSCVATCLFDPVARVGGMNHFLLPGEDPGSGRNVKYGAHSMEQLINDMLRAGALKARLQAWLFGGANVVAGLGGIGDNNAKFARKFLLDEGLSLVGTDLGGRKGRRLRFDPTSGQSEFTAFAIEQKQAMASPRPISAPRKVGRVELF